MWGPWAIGMAITNIRLKEKFEAVGLQLLKPRYGLSLLEQVLYCDMSENVGAHFTSEHFAQHAGVAKFIPMTKPRRSLLLSQRATPTVRVSHVGNDSILVDSLG